MSNATLERYKELSTSSARAEVSAVLNSIITASASAFDTASRGELIELILGDLKVCGKRRLVAKDAAQALLAVKTLGRDPSGSEVIGSVDNLRALLAFQSTLKDTPEATTEALRCIANALLLVDSARSRFLEKPVEGGDTCVQMLEKAQLPDQIFILCRILFLATAPGSTYLAAMMEKKYNGHYIVDIIGSKLEGLINPVQGGANLAREAMTDLLKFTFNILLYYPNMTEAEPQTADRTSGRPKVLGDFWDPKLDGLLSPTLRVFLNLGPTSPCPIAPPLTHVIHALIAIPVTPSLRPVWFSAQSASPGRPSTSSTSKSVSPTPRAEASQSSSRSHSPARSSPASPKPSTLDRAISVLTAGRKSRSSSPVVVSTTQIVNKALDLLDTALARYFPGKIEADEQSVRDHVKRESTDTLDDLLSPLVVLISRLCADETSRVRVRQFIVPDDLDRSSALEERSDILGRCLRLMGSVYHARLKDAIGEMLYAACDSNASVMSGFFGYGNVAGFLFNKGVMSAPAPESGPASAPVTTATGEAINPITGTTVKPKPDGPEMTDEEKEREMDKLLVLFDRLEKTGALPKDQNPIRKAIHEGKFADS